MLCKTKHKEYMRLKWEPGRIKEQKHPSHWFYIQLKKDQRGKRMEYDCNKDSIHHLLFFNHLFSTDF